MSRLWQDAYRQCIKRTKSILPLLSLQFRLWGEFKANEVSDRMANEIRKYVQPLPRLQLYKEVIVSVYNAKNNGSSQ